MLKLAVISHAFVEELFQKRWRLLAEKYPVEVSLLVPEIWRSNWLGDEVVYRPKAVEDGRFRVIPLPTTSQRNWGRYFFKSLDAKFRSIQPHIVYTIHEETIWVNQQIITYRNLWTRSAKLIFFSMNALGVPQKRFYHRLMWRRIKENCDAALCHYPGCLKSLRDGGFEKPIYMQTQIGVDEDMYRPDAQKRSEVRKMLGFEDKFVIGYTGRLTKDKGVNDLLGSLPLDGVDWGLLLVGDGDLREEIERWIADRNWQERVYIVGAVPQPEVADYMRAMDCFVLGSRTMPHWIDTFPNVTVQAMACSVPVVGSDSGAIPFQLGDAGLIFPEGDREKLKEHLLYLANNEQVRARIAEKGRQRSLANFCVRSITDNFYNILQQVHSGHFEPTLPVDDQRKAHTL